MNSSEVVIGSFISAIDLNEMKVNEVNVSRSYNGAYWNHDRYMILGISSNRDTVCKGNAYSYNIGENPCILLGGQDVQDDDQHDLIVSSCLSGTEYLHLMFAGSLSYFIYFLFRWN